MQNLANLFFSFRKEPQEKLSNIADMAFKIFDKNNDGIFSYFIKIFKKKLIYFIYHYIRIHKRKRIYSKIVYYFLFF